jgi:hypothetical protein
VPVVPLQYFLTIAAYSPPYYQMPPSLQIQVNQPTSFAFLRTQLETTLGKPYSRGKLTHRLPNLFYIHQLLQTWPQPSGFSKVFDFAAKVKSPDRL